jgi:hypothetical protein
MDKNPNTDQVSLSSISQIDTLLYYQITMDKVIVEFTDANAQECMNNTHDNEALIMAKMYTQIQETYESKLYAIFVLILKNNLKARKTLTSNIEPNIICHVAPQEMLRSIEDLPEYEDDDEDDEDRDEHENEEGSSHGTDIQEDTHMVQGTNRPVQSPLSDSSSDELATAAVDEGTANKSVFSTPMTQSEKERIKSRRARRAIVQTPPAQIFTSIFIC